LRVVPEQTVFIWRIYLAAISTIVETKTLLVNNSLATANEGSGKRGSERKENGGTQKNQARRDAS